MKHLHNSYRNQGFSLIEMAMVLIIIGLILSAVSVGINLQRSAENNKIKKTFIEPWVQAYNEHYSRTGSVVGDSQIEPRYMVGGNEIQYRLDGGIGIQGLANSSYSGGTEGNGIPGRVCQGQGRQNDKNDRSIIQKMFLFDLMDKHGIRMPAGRAEGREDRYKYLDANGNPQELQICFQWNPPRLSEGSGNVMVIRGLTPSLAREMDAMIDGKPDALEGLFRQQNIKRNTQETHGIAGKEWDANDTYSMEDKNKTTAKEKGKQMDEDRIITVTAIYKMNQ